MNGRKLCPACNQMQLVEWAGPPKAKLALMGEFPGWLETRDGVPWIGEAGGILRSELARVGIQMEACRIGNLWLHYSTKDCDLEYHKKVAIKELRGRSCVLMMGSTMAGVFYDDAISDISGLRVRSKLLPAEVVQIASVNPAEALTRPMGEVRLAVERFADAARKSI